MAKNKSQYDWLDCIFILHFIILWILFIAAFVCAVYIDYEMYCENVALEKQLEYYKK